MASCTQAVRKTTIAKNQPKRERRRSLWPSPLCGYDKDLAVKWCWSSGFIVLIAHKTIQP